MDRWKFVNEKWIPRTVSRGEGYVLGIAASPSNLRPFGAPPSIGRREYPREPLPLEGAAERSEAGLAFFFGGETATFISDSNFSFVQSFRTRSRDGMPRTYYRRTNE